MESFVFKTNKNDLDKSAKIYGIMIRGDFINLWTLSLRLQTVEGLVYKCVLPSPFMHQMRMLHQQARKVEK